MATLRPLRRVRAGVWRSRDERFEFISGFDDPAAVGSNAQSWHVYEVGFNEPVYFDRDATLGDAVERVRRGFYVGRP